MSHMSKQNHDVPKDLYQKYLLSSLLFTGLFRLSFMSLCQQWGPYGPPTIECPFFQMIDSAS